MPSCSKPAPARDPAGGDVLDHVVQLHSRQARPGRVEQPVREQPQGRAGHAPPASLRQGRVATSAMAIGPSGNRTPISPSSRPRSSRATTAYDEGRPASADSSSRSSRPCTAARSTGRGTKTGAAHRSESGTGNASRQAPSAGGIPDPDQDRVAAQALLGKGGSRLVSLAADAAYDRGRPGCVPWRGLVCAGRRSRT